MSDLRPIGVILPIVGLLATAITAASAYQYHRAEKRAAIEETLEAQTGAAAVVEGTREAFREAEAAVKPIKSAVATWSLEASEDVVQLNEMVAGLEDVIAGGDTHSSVLLTLASSLEVELAIGPQHIEALEGELGGVAIALEVQPGSDTQASVEEARLARTQLRVDAVRVLERKFAALSATAAELQRVARELASEVKQYKHDLERFAAELDDFDRYQRQTVQTLEGGLTRMRRKLDAIRTDLQQYR